MPCYFCRHFQEHKGRERLNDVVADVEQATGSCTLSPKWTEVTGLHYCASLSMREPGLVAMWWRYMHETGDVARTHHARAKAAEKKATALRREIKAIKTRERETKKAAALSSGGPS